MKTFFENVTNLSAGKHGLIILLATSAFLKILIFGFSYDQAVNPDGIRYLSAAQQFAAGHFREGMVIYPMPLYPLLIAAVHFLIPNWVLAARLISIFSLVLAIIPLYFLATDLFDRKAAFWACLAFTLAPLPNKWVMYVIRGPGFLVFFACAVYFAQRAIRKPELKYFFGAVLAFWISIGFRIEGIVFFPVYFFFLLGLIVFVTNERSHCIKGILIWAALPVILVVILFVFNSPKVAYFNRIDQVLQEVKNLVHLRFLDNYHQIYQQLKALEDQSPFTGLGKYNVVAIARHYMPVLYWFGLMESLIRVLFPFFVLPLVFGFRRPFWRNHIMILTLVIIYLLALYYYALKVDFVRTRFLIGPAFLLYPWVGAGLGRLFTRIQKSSMQTMLAVIFAGLFIVSPLAKIARSVEKQDNVIVRAAEWITAQPAFKDARIVVNDPRIAFYTGRESYAQKKMDSWLHPTVHYDYSGIESFANEKQGDIIIIRTSVKRVVMLPEFKKFKKFKEFRGKQKIVLLFGSADFLKTINPH
jgi:4-amino-4-deoxy-L-arabinose transferase-like glycosyltransferase